MTNLEQQVTSLELSKRLKDLGVAQDSLFHWWSYGDNWSLGDVETSKKIDQMADKARENDSTLPVMQSYSAFTASELGILLPIGSTTWRYLEEGDEIAWAGKIPGEQNTFGAYDNEANGRARMAIYLKEQELI